MSTFVFEIVITSSKIAGYVFLVFAAFELFYFKNHSEALQWGALSAGSFGVKNVTQSIDKRLSNPARRDSSESDA